MKRDFFLIVGQAGQKRKPKAAKSMARQDVELDLEILKESPCLHCELFVADQSCPHRKVCRKIDEFQRVAASNRTLCKSQDIWSIAKI